MTRQGGRVGLALGVAVVVGLSTAGPGGVQAVTGDGVITGTVTSAHGPEAGVWVIAGPTSWTPSSGRSS